MIDRLRKVLHYSPSQISSDQFHEWKHDPVTEALFKYLVELVINEISEELPMDSIDESLILAHQRQGYLQMIDSLFAWMPENLVHD